MSTPPDLRADYPRDHSISPEMADAAGVRYIASLADLPPEFAYQAADHPDAVLPLVAP